MENKIEINGVIYTVDEAYSIITRESQNNDSKTKDNIFDENGNYSFSTDLKLETPNKVCNIGSLINHLESN